MSDSIREKRLDYLKKIPILNKNEIIDFINEIESTEWFEIILEEKILFLDSKIWSGSYLDDNLFDRYLSFLYVVRKFDDRFKDDFRLISFCKEVLINDKYILRRDLIFKDLYILYAKIALSNLDFMIIITDYFNKSKDSDIEWTINRYFSISCEIYSKSCDDDNESFYFLFKYIFDKTSLFSYSNVGRINANLEYSSSLPKLTNRYFDYIIEKIDACAFSSGFVFYPSGQLDNVINIEFQLRNNKVIAFVNYTDKKDSLSIIANENREDEFASIVHAYLFEKFSLDISKSKIINHICNSYRVYSFERDYSLYGCKYPIEIAWYILRYAFESKKYIFDEKLLYRMMKSKFLIVRRILLNLVKYVDDVKDITNLFYDEDIVFSFMSNRFTQNEYLYVINRFAKKINFHMIEKVILSYKSNKEINIFCNGFNNLNLVEAPFYKPNTDKLPFSFDFTVRSGTFKYVSVFTYEQVQDKKLYEILNMINDIYLNNSKYSKISFDDFTEIGYRGTIEYFKNSILPTFRPIPMMYLSNIEPQIIYDIFEIISNDYSMVDLFNLYLFSSRNSKALEHEGFHKYLLFSICDYLIHYKNSINSDDVEECINVINHVIDEMNYLKEDFKSTIIDKEKSPTASNKYYSYNLMENYINTSIYTIVTISFDLFRRQNKSHNSFFKVLNKLDELGWLFFALGFHYHEIKRYFDSYISEKLSLLQKNNNETHFIEGILSNTRYYIPDFFSEPLCKSFIRYYKYIKMDKEHKVDYKKYLANYAAVGYAYDLNHALLDEILIDFSSEIEMIKSIFAWYSDYDSEKGIINNCSKFTLYCSDYYLKFRNSKGNVYGKMVDVMLEYFFSCTEYDSSTIYFYKSFLSDDFVKMDNGDQRFFFHKIEDKLDDNLITKKNALDLKDFLMNFDGGSMWYDTRTKWQNILKRLDEIIKS